MAGGGRGDRAVGACLGERLQEGRDLARCAENGREGDACPVGGRHRRDHGGPGRDRGPDEGFGAICSRRLPGEGLGGRVEIGLDARQVIECDPEGVGRSHARRLGAELVGEVTERERALERGLYRRAFGDGGYGLVRARPRPAAIRRAGIHVVRAFLDLGARGTGDATAGITAGMPRLTHRLAAGVLGDAVHVDRQVQADTPGAGILRAREAVVGAGRAVVPVRPVEEHAAGAVGRVVVVGVMVVVVGNVMVGTVKVVVGIGSVTAVVVVGTVVVVSGAVVVVVSAWANAGAVRSSTRSPAGSTAFMFSWIVRGRLRTHPRSAWGR